jgi:hypothetical protein
MLRHYVGSTLFFMLISCDSISILYTESHPEPMIQAIIVRIEYNLFLSSFYTVVQNCISLNTWLLSCTVPFTSTKCTCFYSLQFTVFHVLFSYCCLAVSWMSMDVIHFERLSALHVVSSLLLFLLISISGLLFAAHLGNPSSFLQNQPRNFQFDLHIIQTQVDSKGFWRRCMTVGETDRNGSVSEALCSLEYQTTDKVQKRCTPEIRSKCKSTGMGVGFGNWSWDD